MSVRKIRDNMTNDISGMTVVVYEEYRSASASLLTFPD